MPCYCSRISQLERKLADLQRAAELISRAEGESATAEARLSAAADAFTEGFSLVLRQHEIADGIGSGFQAAVSAMSSAAAAVGSAVSSTQRTLQSLRISDEYYHRHEDDDD